MGYDTENGATLIITNFRKKEEKVIVWTWEKGKYKTKKFSKIARVDETKPSALKEQEDSEQCK